MGTYDQKQAPELLMTLGYGRWADAVGDDNYSFYAQKTIKGIRTRWKLGEDARLQAVFKKEISLQEEKR